MNDAEPNPLRARIAALPREIPPARDLWPEIQARLENKPARHPRIVWLLPLAAAAGLAFLAALFWPRSAVPAPSWKVEAMAGTPRVGSAREPGRLHVGDWLETDAAARARLTVGAIGEVSIEPNSRLRLVSATPTDHRLELARGTISALIWAPPRLFFVETPSATAIDLGCAYTLSIGDDGTGELEVTAGYVALEHAGRESIIPAGLMCRTRPGYGPGTPFAVNASAELRGALERFDGGDEAVLPQILAAAAPGDGVTLWHLLDRAPEAGRDRVFDTLARLHPPPPGVTRPGILAGDPIMRDRWAEEAGLFAGFDSKR